MMVRIVLDSRGIRQHRVRAGLLQSAIPGGFIKRIILFPGAGTQFLLAAGQEPDYATL